MKPQAAPKRGTAATMRLYASCSMRSYTALRRRSVRFRWKSSRALWSSAGQVGSSSWICGSELTSEGPPPKGPWSTRHWPCPARRGSTR
eukprot:scaffold133689_cov75-Phaeocystis_antarctica.AAC.1